MANVTDARTGTCSTHGSVEAEPRLPKLTFMFIVTGSTRSLVKANRSPRPQQRGMTTKGEPSECGHGTGSRSSG